MAKRFIDGKTDEDWALANDLSAANDDRASIESNSPPRFARVKPTTVEEPSIMITTSIVNDESGFTPFGG